ncbi:MAG: D-alanine--D-alanine ligase [Chloroflexi bacterium]|jgi:D-alanine-D-alanine ligase|nr:D-alanine--D-alanine ligase [Chloroflexota bacterium]
MNGTARGDGHAHPTGSPRAVAVVYGGPSAEHDVSVVSGSAIAAALAGGGHPVSQFYVDLAGDWWLLPADHRRGGRPPADYDDPAALGAAGPFGAGEAAAGIAGARPQPVVFIALHGPFGEDGTIQAILEVAGLAYTGAGVAASAIGMDKPLFKRFARHAGLPVLDWVEVARDTWDADRGAVLADLERLAAAIPGGRLIAKPACLGSSVGMGIAHLPSERATIVEGALAHDARAIVEPCLDHPRELEVGILGNPATGITVVGPGEVIPGHEFYDYADKYAAGSAARTAAVAEVAPAVATEVRRIGAAAFALIGAAGFARVDFLLDRTTDALVLNEINTIPGFTPISLFPTMADAAGLPFAELCSRIVDLGAAARDARPARRLVPGDLPR